MIAVLQPVNCLFYSGGGGGTGRGGGGLCQRYCSKPEDRRDVGYLADCGMKGCERREMLILLECLITL